MIAIRLDADGRLHWRFWRGGLPDERGREQLAHQLGVEDGDTVILTWERDPAAGCPTSAKVEHYVATVPTPPVTLVKQDGPIEVAR
jgi:hypothetical protein